MSARQVLTRSELGQNLRSRREQENLTQAELASLLGVSSRSVQEWEASRTFPRPAQRRAIAEFMKDAA